MKIANIISLQVEVEFPELVDPDAVCAAVQDLLDGELADDFPLVSAINVRLLET